MHAESKFHINLWPHWQCVYGRSVQSVLHKFHFPFCCLWNTGAWQKTGSYVSGFHSFITDKSLKSAEVTRCQREQRLKYPPGFQMASNSKWNLKAHNFKLHKLGKQKGRFRYFRQQYWQSTPSNHNLFIWLMQFRPHLLVGSVCVKSELSESAPQKNLLPLPGSGEPQRSAAAWLQVTQLVCGTANSTKWLSRLQPFPVMPCYLPVPGIPVLTSHKKKKWKSSPAEQKLKFQKQG